MILFTEKIVNFRFPTVASTKVTGNIPSKNEIGSYKFSLKYNLPSLEQNFFFIVVEEVEVVPVFWQEGDLSEV